MSRNKAEFVLQWNTRSLYKHWGHFKPLIIERNPLVVAVQETRLSESVLSRLTYKIPGYSFYHKSPTLSRCGGTGLFISNNLLHHQITLQANLDAVAVNVKLAHREITIVSIYLSPSHEIDFDSLETLMGEIKTPCLVLGDFNAHHRAWGCDSTQERGMAVLDFIERHNLVYLNNQSPTYICSRSGHISYSAIDLSLASATLASLFEFRVESDPLFSDHYPIILELGVPSGATDFNFLPRWNLKKADWASFANHIDENYPGDAEPDVTTFLNAVLASAHQYIPHTAPRSGRRASPWWNDDCKKAVAIRKRALKQFERCICEHHENEARRTRALADKIIREAKLASWQTYAGQFNRFTPLSKIWSMLRAFSTKRPPLYKIPHLKVDGDNYSMPVAVATQFARHFATISSAEQYPTLLAENLRDELGALSFVSGNAEPYNQPLTLNELSLALSKCGKTSVGPDQIDYSFFKNLSESALANLLSAFNSMWIEEAFPPNWRKSTLVPILKQRKPPFEPASYRPISLTSCACKLFERIINNRLRVYLESNELLSPFQNGFRPSRSTADNLVQLIDFAQSGFHSKQVTGVLFLDLKAAFDKVNKSALLIKLHKFGLRGRMAKFIQNFLENRTFEVRVGNAYSPSFDIDHGVPQGSVISPTLFLIMINDVFDDLPQEASNLKFSLYADDLAVYSNHPEPEGAIQLLQGALDKIAHWCDTWGLKIAPSKSAAMLICKQFSRRSSDIPLVLGEEAIPVVNSFKYLGITLDSGLTFSHHFKDLKQRCARRLNLMKSLAGKDWGGDRSTLLKMYTSLIRPMLDYNAFIFDGISTDDIKTLQIIQNEALRIATGALRPTKVENLHVETNIPLLIHRRKYQLLRFYARAVSYAPTPTAQILTKTLDARRYAKNPKPPIAKRITRALQLFEIEFPGVIATPPLSTHWLDPVPDTYILYPENKKFITPTEALSLFNKFQAEHSAYTFIYTDGSRKDGRTASAFCTDGTNVSYRIPDICGIYTAELCAICSALKYVKRRKVKKAVICTDSFSSISALASRYQYGNGLVAEILEFLKSMDHYQIKFLWIPGHAGIRGNEKADKLAKFGLTKPHPPLGTFSCPLSDIQKLITNQLVAVRQRHWNETNDRHLFPIKPSISHFKTTHQNSREDEVALTRLRVGRTRATHYFHRDRSGSPSCQTCPNTDFTIRHFLLECPRYAPERQPILNCLNFRALDLDLPTLLGDDPEVVALVLEFLHKTRLIYSV